MCARRRAEGRGEEEEEEVQVVVRTNLVSQSCGQALGRLPLPFHRSLPPSSSTSRPCTALPFLCATPPLRCVCLVLLEERRGGKGEKKGKVVDPTTPRLLALA